MMIALDRAATTDLLTGLPDRDLFNRRLLPRALEEHDRVALVVVDIVDFSDAVRGGRDDNAGARDPFAASRRGRGGRFRGGRARRFRDDEIYVILPSINAEDAYRLAEQAESPDRRSGRFAFRCRDRWISGARERRWRTRRRCVQGVEHGQTPRR